MADRVTGDVIAEVRKNSAEVIRVQHVTFNGVKLLDARVWTVPMAPGGEGKPTKKGLSLRPETWAELVAVVEIALEGADGEGE